MEYKKLRYILGMPFTFKVIAYQRDILLREVRTPMLLCKMKYLIFRSWAYEF